MISATSSQKLRNWRFLSFFLACVLIPDCCNGVVSPHYSFNRFNNIIGPACICRVQNNVTACTELSNATCYPIISRQIKIKVENSSSDLPIILTNLFNKSAIEPTILMDLSSNSLAEVDFSLLFTLRNLFAVNLSDNHLTIFENSKNLLNDIHFLHVLDLSYNNIARVDFKDFGDNNRELGILDLGYNRVRQFLGHLSVFSLNLTHNHIEDIRFDFFQNVSNVQELNLEYNNLYKIDYQALGELINLKDLKLSYNSLKQIHFATFFNLDKLLDLELEFNNISKLDSRIFNQMIDLRKLNISHNNLRSIHYETFHKLDRLISLDLSHNKIIHFFEYTFMLGKLKFLAINYNQIKFLNLDHILKFTKILNTLHVDNNPWDCKNLSNIVEQCQQQGIVVRPNNIVCKNTNTLENIETKSNIIYVYVVVTIVYCLLWVYAVVRCLKLFNRTRHEDEMELLELS